MDNIYVKVLLIVLLVAVVVLTVLYFMGKRLEKKNVQNKEMMESMAQSVKILVIDKRKMKLKEAKLPKIVYEQTPKYLRRSKVPIVKAKIGPKTMSLISAPEIFDIIPVGREVQATLSGIYISAVKGKLLPKPEKLSFRQKLMKKIKK